MEVPSRLSKEQRRLFEELGRSLGHEVTPQKARGLRDRLADFLAGS
ncbi:MAG: hypothetical protein M5U29_09225 [Anaerolineae bacterium]|nr:hypothetical protein [Anaerolineae bacterium]